MTGRRCEQAAVLALAAENSAVFAMPPEDPGLGGIGDVLVPDRPPPAPSPVSASAQTASAHAMKILILEDEPADAELIQRALRKAGLDFTARRVDSRAGFIAALETFAPDIVLSDYGVPGFNGAEALSHVRHVHPEIPVVMITGARGEEAAVALLKAGAADYVLNGNLARLPAAVERAISVEHGIRARKAAERALRATNTLLQTAERIAHIGGFDWDIATGRIVWSEETYRMFGLVPGEFLPSVPRFVDCIHPDDRARVQQAIDASVALNQPFDAEFRILTPDKTERIIQSRGELVSDETGKPVRMTGTSQDITERKRIENALRASEVRYHDLFASTRDAIMLLEPSSGRFISANPSTVKLFGARDEVEFLTRKPWEHSPERQPDGRGSAEKAHEMIEIAMRAGSHLFEWTHKRSDGVEFPADVLLSQVAHGEETLIYASVRDITDRRRAEEDLRSSEERFRLLVEEAPDAILLYDIDQDHLISANKAAERLFGCAREEIVEHGPQHFYAPEQPDSQPVAQSFAEHNASALAGEELIYERRILNGLGQERLCQVTLVQMPSPGQRLLRASFIDITERKEAERALAFERTILATEHELSPDGILVVDSAATIVSFNRRFGEIMNVPPELLAARRDEPVLAWVTDHMADPEGFLSRVRYLNEHLDENSFEEIVLKDGRVLDRYSMPLRLADSDYLGRVWYFHDITERKAAERTLRRLNRTLMTLSRGNEALVRAISEPELLTEMCRVIVEIGGYRMAWVGIRQEDAAKSVTPVAWAGEIGQYLETARITWADEARGRGPHGRAIRTGEAQVTQDLRADPAMAPWREAAKERGFASSVVLPLKDASGVFAALTIDSGETGAFDTDELKLLQELADDLAFGIRSLRDRRAHETLDQRWRTSLEATVGAIANTVEMRDPYTSGHQQRVARLAVAMAREMALPDHRIQGLYLAGIIHDVGKINIPSEILNKPGKISKLEYQLIQGHAEAGYDIVKGVDFPWPIADMVRQHHERLDGSGYPQGLKGEAILLEARIISVADVVEAMMSHRPYRPALGIDAALAEIENGKGGLYDPEAVDACVALFRQQGFGFE
jgi:PAS domain S-box-containing protein